MYGQSKGPDGMSLLTKTKTDASPQPRTKERKKKPDELLSSVVRETPTAAAVELLRQNTPFAFPSETAWVALILPSENIGGLTRRQKRNEAKGSIIELIDSDHISTVATETMLADEEFAIIPTQETLERMREYSLLTEAEYKWAVLYQESDELRVEQTGPATFEQARRVSSGVESLRKAVGDPAWNEHSGQDAEPSHDPEIEEPTPNVETDEPELIDEGDDLFADDFFDEDPAEETPDFDDESPEFLPEDDDIDDDDVPEFDEGVETKETKNEPDPEPLEDETDHFVDTDSGHDEDPEINQDQVRASIARRFLSEDLDLDISLDEFFTNFNIGTPVVQIDVPQPQGVSSWLSDQIGQVTRQANAELRRLHEAGEAEMQSEYVNLMSLHAERIIEEVATDQPGSIYTRLTDEAEETHQQRLAQRDEETARRKSEIEEEFEDNAKRAGVQAANLAEEQYRGRHRSRMQRDQLEAAASIESRVENEHSADRQKILDLRRKDANSKMFVGQSRIFKVMAERQAENLAAERKLLESWSEKINALIDDFRKDDISRAETLAEEQARSTEVADLKQDHEQTLQKLRMEQEERTQWAETEVARAQKEAAEKMRAREEEWSHVLGQEKQKTEAASRRATDLLEQMRNQGETFKDQYDARLNELKADREAYIQDLKRSHDLQSRSTKLMITLMIMISVLTLFAGFIVGMIL